MSAPTCVQRRRGQQHNAWIADEDLIYQALHAALFAVSWTLSWGES